MIGSDPSALSLSKGRLNTNGLIEWNWIFTQHSNIPTFHYSIGIIIL